MTRCPICVGQYRCNCKRRQSPLVRAHLRAIAKRGNAAAAKVKHLKACQRWQTAVAGKTAAEAWRAVYRLGYKAGYMRGVLARKRAIQVC